jgi:hypothetical protein
MSYVFSVHPSYYISNLEGGGSYQGGEDPVTARAATEMWKLQHIRGEYSRVFKFSLPKLPSILYTYDWHRLNGSHRKAQHRQLALATSSKYQDHSIVLRFNLACS